MNRPQLERLLTQAAKAKAPGLLRAGRLETLREREPPVPQASFGYVGPWFELSGPLHDAHLALPFDPKRIGWIDARTLQLFRFDAKLKRFEPLAESWVNHKARVVHGPVALPGLYGLVGLHGHPLVRDTIQKLCAWRSMPGGRPGLGDRICEEVLCNPAMKPALESRAELEHRFGPLGPDAPDGMPPLLVQPAYAGETICARSHGVGGFVPEMPECHVLKPRHVGPCNAAAWEVVGPGHISGVIRQLVMHPVQSQRLYAVSANGGIWRLDNAGDYPNTRWRPITDRLANLRFRALAIAPGSPAVLYAANATKTRPFSAATVYSEILVSRNGGTNWTPIHQGGMGVVYQFAVHPANADVVFAATSTGLWRQSEIAGGWTLLFAGSCSAVVLDPQDSSIVYLGVRNVGLFKSFTSGADWPQTPLLAYNAAAASDDPTTPNTERNRTSIQIALGLRRADGSNQTPQTRTVLVRFGNQLSVHAAGGDDAAGWRTVVPSQIVPNPDPATVANRPNVDKAANALNGGNLRRSDVFPALANDWVNCLAVDPFDPDHLLVGGVSMLRSIDGGQTWAVLGDFGHEDHHSVVFDPNQQGRVFASNDGGLFLSVDGAVTRPSMSLAHTQPSAQRGANFAMGLITSEIRSTVVRAGRCVASIDHTGFIASDNFDARWQFLFDGPDSSNRHIHEGSLVFACPGSLDRYYVLNNRNRDDPSGVRGRLAQMDFTRTNGLIDRPSFAFLTTGQALDLPAFLPDTDFFVKPTTAYVPDDLVYDTTLDGPFAVRHFADDDLRLILYGTALLNGVGFTIQSLRMASAGTAVNSMRQEAVSPSPFVAILFGAPGSLRAFAITQNGTLWERDFSVPNGQFTAVSQFALGAGDVTPTRLIRARAPHLRLYAISQTRIARYDDDGQSMTTVYTLPNGNEERVMSIAAHPQRDGTLFVGTTRGVHVSDDDGTSWRPYRQGMPSVPVTQLIFDQSYLYAATFGRGLWRCRPCP